LVGSTSAGLFSWLICSIFILFVFFSVEAIL
jgi:hypothetical protein